MKKNSHIVIAFILLLISACTGTKKFFKAAEKLELQGLIGDAAEYYYQSLLRKPTNVDARIKLKEVGQKYVSSLSSEFFRNYNTQQIDASLETFEKMKNFNSKVAALNVQLDYPKSYDDDYANAVEQYNSKNYNQAALLVNQKKYSEATGYINKVKKYNAAYKDLPKLEITAVCEPLYQNAVQNIENKNYASAYTSLSTIKNKTDNYKDAQQLLELADAQQNKNVILFQPKATSNAAERNIEESLFNNFQAAQQQLNHVKLINNTPFQDANKSLDLNNSNNVDLIQAIRKATDADYFYLYDVKDIRTNSPAQSRTKSTAWQAVTTKSGTTTVTRYDATTYYIVKGQRSFAYNYNYQLINAYSNQIIEAREQTVMAQDAIEYNEGGYNANSLYPYNPQQAPLIKPNVSAWRSQFSARTELKPYDVLQGEAVNQTIHLFLNTNKNLR